jgi:GDP-4-dehydro-6-deoxy-D-mannose reductase
MKYLITGITGFAGPHLANLLIEEGHEVHGLVRGSNGMETDILDIVPTSNFDNITFIYGDLTNRQRMDDVIKGGEYDGVFHLAAQSHPPTSFLDPVGTFDSNVMGSINIIEAIVRHRSKTDTKLMFCSTSEVYGNTGSDGRMLKEDDPILPSNPYGNSKAAIDLYLQERFTNNKIRGFITRAFSHTGPRRGKTFSISSDAYQLAKIVGGEPLKVGNLSTTRVVMDVRDTVRAYYLLMQEDKSDGQVFNVCGDTPRRMEFFTDLLIDIHGKDVEKIIHKPFWRPHDISYQHADVSKLTSLTGWDPKISIQTTMEDLYGYWRVKHGRA